MNFSLRSVGSISVNLETGSIINIRLTTEENQENLLRHARLRELPETLLGIRQANRHTKKYVSVLELFNTHTVTVMIIQPGYETQHCNDQ